MKHICTMHTSEKIGRTCTLHTHMYNGLTEANVQFLGYFNLSGCDDSSVNVYAINLNGRHLFFSY